MRQARLWQQSDAFLRSCDFIDSVSFFQKHKESVYIFETLNGLKAASLGLIVSAAATIILLSFFGTGDPDLKTMKESLDIGAVAIFGGVLFLSRKRKINPIMLMLVSGAAGIILYM